jgi:hypothetical protein
LELKASHPALSNEVSANWVHHSEPDRVLSFSRILGHKTILVILNFSYDPQQVSLYADDLKGNYHSLFSKQPYELDGNKIDLQGYEGLVLVK